MAFTRSVQNYTAGEKVLVKGHFVAEPAVVVAVDGARVEVAIAPESNRTEDVLSYETWERRVVEPRTLRRYEW